MLAHAFLAVAAAIERDHAPAPASSRSPSTSSVAYSTRCSSAANTPSTPCSPGHDGADDIKPAPAPVTTADGNNNIDDHELRLS
jgi:hypothetical protein